MRLLTHVSVLLLAAGSCIAATFPPPRWDLIPPPHQDIPHNTMHALYFDATRQAYVQHAFAVMKVMRAEWKKALQKMVMLPMTHG